MWVTASEHGLSLNESKTLDIMREVVDLAKIGLRARGAGEEKFLEPALTRLEQRKTPTDDMIKAFNVGGMQQLIKEFKRVI
jgi:gamma-glutamylcysteine synthetase